MSFSLGKFFFDYIKTNFSSISVGVSIIVIFNLTSYETIWQTTRSYSYVALISCILMTILYGFKSGYSIFSKISITRKYIIILISLVVLINIIKFPVSYALYNLRWE